MRLKQAIIEWQRQRAVDKVIRIGKRLRTLEAEAAQGSDHHAEIHRLTQERDRLLDFIRTTAP